MFRGSIQATISYLCLSIHYKPKLIIMKNQTFLKIIAVFFISLFFINVTNAQCIPNAGVDTATCGLTYNLDAIPQNSGASAQWTVYTKPVGAAVVFSNETSFNTDVDVTEYGTYEFVIEENSGACTDYDTILVEFIRIPVISAGDDQYICCWKAQMEAQMDPSGTSVEGMWDNADIFWVDSVYWTDTPCNSVPVPNDPTQQFRPNAYVLHPVPQQDGSDTVMMIWLEYSVGDVFTNHQCYAKDTVMLYFYAEFEAENNTVLLDTNICGREIELSNSQEIYSATGYWIDSLGIVINWDPTNSSQNTTATVANYGTDAFAFVIENGNIPGSNYPVCSDTSEFIIANFVQKPTVDACLGCYRLQNTTLPDGFHVDSVRTDTVCFNDYSDFYQLSGVDNIGDSRWTKVSAGIFFANPGPGGSGSTSSMMYDNDSVYVNIFNSAGIPNNDYYVLVFSSTTNSSGCESRDTLLLSIAKKPSAEIGFIDPYFHNKTAKIWAEPDTLANPTVFNWTFNDNPIFDSVIVSGVDSIYYPHWNQTECDSLEHMVTLQASSGWGCVSQNNTVYIQDLQTIMPLTNNTQPTPGMNDGVIRFVPDSMVDCDGTFQISYTHCWISSTLQEDLANNIPSFDNQINFGANCDVDSIYGLRAEDTCWFVVEYSLIIDTLPTKTLFTDTLSLQVGNNTTVEEIDFNKILKVYPNPAKEQLTVVGLDELNISKIEIFDISGKVLKTLNVYQTSKEFKINISDLNEGIYFIKLGNYVGKFVKQ